MYERSFPPSICFVSNSKIAKVPEMILEQSQYIISPNNNLSFLFQFAIPENIILKNVSIIIPSKITDYVTAEDVNIYLVDINPNKLINSKLYTPFTMTFLSHFTLNPGNDYDYYLYENIYSIIQNNNKTSNPKILNFYLNYNYDNLKIDSLGIDLKLEYEIIFTANYGNLIKGSDFNKSSSSKILHTDFQNRTSGQIIKATDF